MRPVLTRRLAVACVALLLGAGSAGCGSDGSGDRPASAATSPVPSASVPSDAAPSDSAASVPPAEAAPAMSRSEPTRVTIASAQVDTGPVLKLGLNSDGTVEVPSVAQADRIGWYDKSVTPGETGPAVLIGHFDTVNGPAVLSHIAQVGTGDRIEVTRADGSRAVFAVRGTQQVAKTAFPTEKVYGNTDHPELRLITCGGPVENGHHPDNIIVYGDLVRR